MAVTEIKNFPARGDNLTLRKQDAQQIFVQTIS